MPLFAFEGRAPRVDPTAFVAPTATLIGDVTVEAGASVWFNAVLRADYGPIIVREGANVQDGSVLHAPPGIAVDMGPGATVAHMCCIHGVHVGSEALIANHATVLDGAVIGARSLIAAPSLVTAGSQSAGRGIGARGAVSNKGPDRRNRRGNVGQPQSAGLSRPGSAAYDRTGADLARRT